MESKFPELLDARGDQGALEIKSPRNRGLLHSDVDYYGYLGSGPSPKSGPPVITHQKHLSTVIHTYICEYRYTYTKPLLITLMHLINLPQDLNISLRKSFKSPDKLINLFISGSVIKV